MLCEETLIYLYNFVAYQYGVPTKELAGQAMEAEPKSASLTCPGSVSKMFPALISLSNTEQENIKAPNMRQLA